MKELFNKQICIIGAGNIGKALGLGLIKNENIKAKNITFTRRHI